MSELQSLSPDLLIHVAGTLQIPLKGLVATIELLDEGATVPFIARYRKESTGNLDEVQIRAIEEKLLYFRELVSRKETILASIQEQGKLTDELKARIDRDTRQERTRRSLPSIQTQAPHQGDDRAGKGSGTARGLSLESRADGYAARNIRRFFCRRRERRRERGRSARRGAPHRCRNHQRQRGHSQAAAPRHV